jgi:DNA-binding SARP family transcriptional activator
MKIVVDSIPFKFRDSETWSYLYLNEEKSALIAVVVHQNHLALYTIAYPPLFTKEVQPHVPVSRFPLFCRIGAALFAVFVLLAVFIYGKKNRRYLIRRCTQVHVSLEPLPAVRRKPSSAIHLLGGFQVFDAKEKNITSAFSPTLRQLFLFLLFHSIHGRRGVTSARLDEVLWHDKTGDSARNNRNVNISKLRAALDEAGSIEVINKNSLWSLQFGDTAYCDYLEVMALLSKARTDVISTDETFRLAGLLHIGELLPDLQTEWLAFYKSDYTREVTDVLGILLNRPKNEDHINLCYHIAELLLTIDPLNEEAILVKCSLLNATGRKSQAKKTFDLFTQEYEALMGSPYPASFDKTVKK